MSADDTSHALTPRNPREALALKMVHADMASPLEKTYGGIDLVWLLDRLHPANVAGIFQKHDQSWDYAYGGLLKAQSSQRYDEDLRDEILELAEVDLAALPYPDEDSLAYARRKFPPSTLRTHADIAYGFCRAYGIFFWPEAAKEDDT